MRGRPRRGRRIGTGPRSDTYKPAGIPAALLEEVRLTAAETEAIRLVDLEGRSQQEAAERMGISQPTLHRELAAARAKVADALLNGKAILLAQGGERMPQRDGTGPEGKGPRTGRGLGGCPPMDDQEEPGSRPRFGRGAGRGRGAGQGMGRGRGRRG